ncbi:GntR family transcriptional regulator [Streptomyces californicus]|uniref:GntR family transcriptional regulator n=1 Tax=Streptomyces californicus TaxID=67351 RepID=UPI00378C1360
MTAPTAHRPPAGPVAHLRAAGAIRDRITAGFYVPGARLTLRELTASTGYEHTVLRAALDDLATTNAVEGRWRVADPRPGQHTQRIVTLLAGMVDQGAWPAGASLPARPHLVRMLLTEPGRIAAVHAQLAERGVLHLTPSGAPRVLPAPDGSPARRPWPPGERAVLTALPARTQQGAGHDAATLHLVRFRARRRWKSGVALPAPAMAQQEVRQAETAFRLISRAFALTSTRSPDFLPSVRSAAARVTACHALPTTTAALYERLYRFAVLSAALAQLADELTAAATRPSNAAPPALAQLLPTEGPRP